MINYVFDIIDEIALEGLDGITLPSLCLRLKRRKNCTLFQESVQDNSRVHEFIWNCAIFDDSIQIYQLSTERPPLIIFDRFQHVDPDLGIILEPENVPNDIYPYSLVEDGLILGSCATYKTRTNITISAKKLTYQSLIKSYGAEKVVLVASQEKRAACLLGSKFDLITNPLSSKQWVILERIGRARELGEVSQGKLSLKFMNENAKCLFYHRKALVNHKLITKQIHHQKSGSQNYQGTLFHLPRFYVERKSKRLFYLHKIIHFLKRRANGMATYEEIRNFVSDGIPLKKLYKTPEFQRYIKGGVSVSNKELFSKDSSSSSSEKERNLRVIQLHDPNIDPETLWQREETEDFEGEDGSEDCNGFHDQSQWFVDVSFLKVAYMIFEKATSEGLSQQELSRTLGVGKLEARSICRNLERRSLVSTVLQDRGRQRTNMYVIKKYENTSSDSLLYASEKAKKNNLSIGWERLDSSKEIDDEEPILKTSRVPSSFEVTICKEDSILSAESNISTFRQLKRANFILETIRQHVVIEGAHNLYKMILRQEETEGIASKMDKKSLLRLLSKLAQEGQIKNIKMILKDGDQEKILHFICEPYVTPNHSRILSALEQAKMKLDIAPKSSYDLFKKHPSHLPSSSQSSRLTFNSKFGKEYGLKPKFVRLREFHLLLFYLNHGYSERKEVSIPESWYIKYETKEFPPLYSSEISWKMFISPLPNHDGWSSGWCLLSDVLLRLPLSLFVQLVNLTFEIPELKNWLSHPIKTHYCLQTLPAELRKQLLYHRKYIFSAYELCSRLCYIGLLQFGPQKLKEKDQVFIYVNQKASLIDTTSSTPHYHKVQDKDYPLRTYSFETLNDVEQYWYQMWEICVNTPLGGSSHLTGNELPLENMDKKPKLMDSLTPRKNEEASQNDRGLIPGDHLGSAGLDSSMFSHLKRNWSWNSSTMSSFENKGKEENKVYVPKKQIISKVSVVPNTRSRKRKRDSTSSYCTPKRSSKIRVLSRRSVKEERRPYYDEADKAALKLMRKLRVDWSSTEDSFLLLCKVASSYLYSSSSSIKIPYIVIRDELHKRLPESHNKTSRACQRRLGYMMKNKDTMDNVTMYLADASQDLNIKDKFPIDSVKNQKKLEEFFVPLLSVLIEKYQKNHTSETSSLTLPNNLEDLKKDFHVVFPLPSLSNKHGFQEPESIDDISCSVIHALITSSLCSASDKTSWAFQLYKIYQQYSDTLLKSVMTKLRSDKMVSLKKQYHSSKVGTRNYLPLSSSPYQLSVTFSHILLSRYTFDIYGQAYDALKILLKGFTKAQRVEIRSEEGGHAAAVVGLMAKGLLAFKTIIPEQLVFYDPKASSHSGVKLASFLERYPELVSFKTESQERDEEKVKGSETSESNEEHKNWNEDQIVFQKGRGKNSSSSSPNKFPCFKSASRLALYMMREEYALSSSSVKSLGHSHDFFAVSSCKIELSYVSREKEKKTERVEKEIRLGRGSNSFTVSQNILPGNVTEAENILNSYGVNIYGSSNSKVDKLKKTCLSDKSDSYETSKEESEVVSYVSSFKEFGATSEDLKKHFRSSFSSSSSFDSFQKLVKSLLDKGLLIRSGINKTRYIAMDFATPWILNSFRLTRTLKESTETRKVLKYLDISSNKPSSSYQAEISEATSNVDWSKVQGIKILIRPWLRVDGTLNRRVFDRLLGTVLGQAMTRPGMSLRALQDKLIPALLPQHSRELVELLEKLEIVEISKLEMSSSPDALFTSSSIPILTSSSSFLDDEKELYIEPCVDAIVKFGQFIGDKQYNHDFVCHCPCHPDK